MELTVSWRKKKLGLYVIGLNYNHDILRRFTLYINIVLLRIGTKFSCIYASLKIERHKDLHIIDIVICDPKIFLSQAFFCYMPEPVKTTRWRWIYAYMGKNVHWWLWVYVWRQNVFLYPWVFCCSLFDMLFFGSWSVQCLEFHIWMSYCSFMLVFCASSSSKL